MAPSGGTEDVPKDVAERTRPANVAPDVGPLVEGNAERVVRPYVFGKTVGGAVRFRLKGTKQSVPDDEDARVVFVEVREIGAVVNPVVRWRIEQPLDGRGQAADILGVNPELVKQTHGLHGHDGEGRKAQQRQPEPEQKRAGQRTCPSLAQSGAEIILRRRMMDYV